MFYVACVPARKHLIETAFPFGRIVPNKGPFGNCRPEDSVEVILHLPPGLVFFLPKKTESARLIFFIDVETI
jgi:hypothetical protein